MCGIVVVIDKKSRAQHPQAIKNATQALHHRGPDDSSEYYFENVSLGHTRLSIVDISDGEQPFFSEDNSVVLICNGEIYNFESLREKQASNGHSLRSRCDSEVIVHEYEDDPISYIDSLQGMFAFALLDKKKRTMHFGRDRLGIKPLYYYDDQNFFICSSEIKGIAATGLVPLNLNRQAIYDTFTFVYPPGEQTSFENISAIAPAHLLEYSLSENRVALREYWHPNFPPRKQKPGSFTRHQQRLRDEVTQAVSSHSIGDVPICAYLSGGIDSTIISSLLAKQKTPDTLRTYSISFDDPLYDESPVFKKTIETLNLDGHIEHVGAASAELFEKTVEAIEQPQFSSMDIPLYLLSKRVRNDGIKVVMTGDGPDEILGGYPSYMMNQIQRALSLRGISALKPMLLKRALRYFIRSNELRDHLYSCYMADNSKVVGRFGAYPAWYPTWLLASEQKKPFFLTEFSDSLGEGSYLANACNSLKNRYRNIDEFDKSVYLDLRLRIPNYILTRTDKLAMANSVEARVPFLDTAATQRALSIPVLFKLFGFKEKFILKKSFKGSIPAHIAKQRKFAYKAPSAWLWSGDSEKRDTLMSEEYLKKSGIFDPAGVRNNIDLLRKGALSENNKVGIESMLSGVYSTQLLYHRFVERAGA